MEKKCNGVASVEKWRSAMAEDRLERAEHLQLPSGATILVIKPEPLEWILSGRIPQRLLSATLQSESGEGVNRAMTREEILDLAQFARQLVLASVVEPRIGEGPGEIALDEVPVEDRAFIFEWACRALGREKGARSPESGDRSREENSSEKLERFREG